MMNKLAITIILILVSVTMTSQQYSKKEKLERLKAQKVAFITNRLELSSDEAQLFWPVYNDFFKKKEQLGNQKRAVTRDLQSNWQTYSEEKKTELLDKMINFKLKEATLEQSYHSKFKSVLSIDKVIKLYAVETQFKTYLLKQIKNQATKDIRSLDRETRRR